MGNTYGKPTLPAINQPKTCQGTSDISEDLLQKSVIQVSHNPGQESPRKAILLHGYMSQAQTTTQSITPKGVQLGNDNHRGMQVEIPLGAGKPHAMIPTFRPPVVPILTLPKHDTQIFVGVDQIHSARMPAVTPAVLPTVQRMPVTARPTCPGPGTASNILPYEDTGRHMQHPAITPAPGPPPLPWTPAQTLRWRSNHLSNYELSEILQYTQIYFWGQPGIMKVRGNPHLAKTNYGYDDDRGDYQAVLHDHIAYRFELVDVLGKGSFGQVLKVLDHKAGTYKALKIIRNKKRFHHQAQVELKVLEHLRVNDPDDLYNVIHIQESFTFRNHLCITFELLHLNLYEYLKSQGFVGTGIPLLKKFTVQLLQSLKFLKREKIIHCDLKPENILLKEAGRSAIKIIDFGSSCFQDERIYTYIQSRFYRSPEVILGFSYGPAIDMWSLGCILAEMLTGYPLFPGEDEHEQLLCIMEILGLPPRAMMEQASRRKAFFDSTGAPRVKPNSRGKVRQPGTKSLYGVLRCSDLTFVDFLERCLKWDPHDRLTPEQALQHVFIADQVMSLTSYRPAYAKTRPDQVTPHRHSTITTATSNKSSPRQIIPKASEATLPLLAGGTPRTQAHENQADTQNGLQKVLIAKNDVNQSGLDSTPRQRASTDTTTPHGEGTPGIGTTKGLDMGIPFQMDQAQPYSCDDAGELLPDHLPRTSDDSSAWADAVAHCRVVSVSKGDGADPCGASSVILDHIMASPAVTCPSGGEHYSPAGPGPLQVLEKLLPSLTGKR